MVKKRNMLCLKTYQNSASSIELALVSFYGTKMSKKVNFYINIFSGKFCSVLKEKNCLFVFVSWQDSSNMHCNAFVCVHFTKKKKCINNYKKIIQIFCLSIIPNLFEHTK